MPLVSASTVPAALTPIVGRERDLERVLATIDRGDTRLVTLTGLGGIGKTRLAVAVADAAQDQFHDGVLFVDLAAISDPRQVIAAIAAAAGIQERGADPVADLLRAHLHHRQTLLVLDNFEHLLPATPAVLDLLGGCPALKILVTSRIALHVRGEREISLEPLPLPPGDTVDLAELSANPAVALFTERAEHVTPRFALTEETAPLVAAICRRLDGIPLAIELAAPWVRMLPAGTLLTRLDHRLSLLGRGTRDLPDRQQTLRATLDWSYRLLGPADQAVFRRSALFAGSWSLAAAEAVCTGWITDADPADVLGAMGSLVDHSLCFTVPSNTEEPRFGMLETVREFALERLDAAGERSEAGARLSAWSVAFAEEAAPGLFGPDQGRWLDVLDTERLTVRLGALAALDRGDAPTAIRIAVALGRFWLVRGHQLPDHEWLQGAIDATADHPDPAVRERRAFALLLLGNSWFERGELIDAIATYRQSADAAQAAGSAAFQASALLNFGIVSAQIGDLDAARSAAEQALALNRAIGNRSSIGKDLIILGGVLNQQGDPDAAQPLLDEALAINLDLGDTRVVALNFNTLGEVARSRGDAATATRLFAQSRSLSDEIGEKRGSATALANLGWLALDQGLAAEARDHFHAAMLLRREIGDRWNLAECAEGFSASVVVEHPETALGLLAAAAAIKSAIAPTDIRPLTAQTEARARANLDPAVAAATWAAATAQPTSDGLLAAATAVLPAETPLAAPPDPAPSAAQAPDGPASPRRASDVKLSRREREVLAMLVTGHQDREIAAALFITPRTASWHVTNILAKLGVPSRVAAAVLAIREGLVDPSTTP